MSKETLEKTQGHKFKRQIGENKMWHPAGSEAWKDFDRRYPWFAQDARNLRLGLSTDGFNPSGHRGSSDGMWPVSLIMYNLPPWECMDKSNSMMTMHIPGPKAPGKGFDVFLQPLVEELLELWEGTQTYDASTKKKFTLHAALLWYIHDYPAQAPLSGYSSKGCFACVRCDEDARRSYRPHS